jgi:hypothetical protein
MIAMFLGVWSAGIGDAAGQARASAQRRFEVAPFAQATYLSPNYSQPSTFGYAAGVDITPFLLRLHVFQPALELRFTGDSGPAAHEYTYSGGLKAAIVFHGMRPYATLLRGLDAIYFTHPTMASNGPYTHDSSRMFSFGGGAEFDVGPSWQVRVDYSKQYWALDQPFLRPYAVSLGVTYRIP